MQPTRPKRARGASLISVGQANKNRARCAKPSIADVDSHHQRNEVLLKTAGRNIASIPNNYTPEHTIMKRQVLLSIAFSVFAVNAFAATSAHPVVAEGGSDRLIESRAA